MQPQRTPHRTDAKRGPKVRVATGIYKRGGKYLIYYTDEQGRAHLKTTDAKNLTEARQLREALRVKIRAGEIKVGDRTLSLAGVVESFVARERSSLAARSSRTIDLYEQRLASHVVPRLGRIKVADLNVQHIRHLVDRLRETGLSGSTIRGCVTALSAVLRHAVRDLGTISRNPCRDLERGDLPSAKRQSEPRYLAIEQVESILANMTSSFRPVAATCFWAGLRISEALALRWEHIDFEGQTISVPGAKTEKSAAAVPLLPKLARELLAHRERQGTKSFITIRPDELVFQTARGLSPGRRNALRALQVAAESAGVLREGHDPVGLHDLRHSLAANAFALGLAPTEVARLLRHANPRVTLTVYAGVAEGEVINRIGQRLTAGGFGS